MTGILLGAGLAVSSLAPAFADDSEIYVGGISTVKPNILLIIDTSFSMDTTDAVDDHPTFKPGDKLSSYSKTFAGCTDAKIFYTVGTNQPDPTCDSLNYISSDTSSLQYCEKLATAVGTSGPSGRWTGKAGQFNTTTKSWEDLLPSGTSGKVECLADRGVHGQATGATSYARNGNTTPWTSNALNEINWAQRQTYTFYSARWVTWNSQTPGTYTMSRMEAVRNAANDLVSSIDDVNIGVMRFNPDSGATSGTDAEFQGGSVVQAVKDVTVNRNSIISTISALTSNSATPLSETMYESYLYWSGKKFTSPDGFGGSSTDAAAKAASGTEYQSPIAESCQRNFNILLTDGHPTWDNQRDTEIGKLLACSGQPGDTTLGPATGSPASRANAGRCLDEISQVMASKGTDLSPLDGEQTVKTFTIGFGKDSATPPFGFLKEVASDGGGTFYTATNVSTLNKALTDITTNIANISSTFATASIGVNSFNRAATRDELYFAVFNSDDHLRWDGNLKKYKLGAIDTDGAGPLPPRLVVQGTTAGVDAVDAKGFFKDGTRSFWSSVDDGADVLKGGAAENLPATRKILTHIGANPAGAFANLIPINSAAVDDTVLGTPAGAVTRTSVLNFATSVSPRRMGDPLHSQPAVVTYAGTATSPIDVVYSATNDGYLHAIDAATGVEKWAFIPQELLPRLKDLVADPAATTRSYGLDGDIRILKLDFNGDGDVDSGDAVWLFVGMRRGGKHYYALDVTDRNDPKLMWKDGPSATAFTDMGETWSPPTIARVEVSGATQNNQKLVLIFGGGYDGSQENYSQVSDAVGNNIWMVDAKSGKLLWSAGSAVVSPEPAHDLTLASMTNSIPGRISVLDINGDGYADRMYAADTGGRIFRFDIFSGKDATSLVTGAVFAKLGTGAAAGGDDSPASKANTRRFYSAPDVALIQRRGSDPYYNIAIGSGYRGHPLYRQNMDRFYSLRDKQPYAKFATNPTLTILTEASTGVVDITPDPINANVGSSADGWKLVFDPAATQSGEKVLNEATTVNGVVLFTTYAPQAASTAEPCRPTSVNKVYALRADNGHPALDLNNDGKVTNADLFEEVKHEGILGGVNVGVLRGTLADSLGEGKTPTVCLAGMHILGKCVDVSDSVRTYWRKDVDQQ